MEMTPEEVEAVGILIANTEWHVFIGYVEKLLNFERDKCVSTDKEKVPIHQGRARAFREIVDIETRAGNIYESRKRG